LVAAHGIGIATGMADTANWLLGTDVVQGFDVPMDTNHQLTYLAIKEFLFRRPEIKDVFLMVDMGSLVTYSYELERDLGIRARCISLVSTPFVVEAGRKALLGYSLQDVFEDVRKLASRMMWGSAYEGPVPVRRDRETAEAVLKASPGGFPPDHPVPINGEAGVPGEDRPDKLYLLTVCTTGEGSARILRNYLLEKLDLKNGLCEIIPLQATCSRDLWDRVEALSASGRIIGVVSALSTDISAPHFTLTSSMNSSGLAVLQKHIDAEGLFVQIGRNMRKTFPSLRDGGGVWRIRDMIERIGRALDTEMDNEMLIGLFCHICCMLDRLKQDEKVGEFPDIEGWMQKYPREITLIREECDHLADSYQVTISLDEVCFILMFFKHETEFIA
jgi:transcriptional regulatory protein LevR